MRDAVLTDKDGLRLIMRAERRKLPLKCVSEKSTAIARSVINDGHLKNADFVMCYIDAFKEPQTMNIIKELFKMKKRVAVPVSNTGTHTLTVCEIYNTEDLKPGAYNILEPIFIREVDFKEISLVLVPGLAFDRAGGRMGFGMGYYDRLLENGDAYKIGLCYDFQLFDSIPKGEHDIKMDKIITEREIVYAV